MEIERVNEHYCASNDEVKEECDWKDDMGEITQETSRTS